MIKKGILLLAVCISFLYPAAKAQAGEANAVFGNASELQVLQAANSGLGVPYVWGGTTTAGWDCSGYVTWVGRQLGVDMGRNTSDIVRYCTNAGAAVLSGFSAEDFNSGFNAGTIRPGDILIFFNSSGVNVHTAIVGNGQTVYHAWYDGVGTVRNRFDEMWSVDGGHGKSYASYTVYRGVLGVGKATVRKSSSNAEIDDGNQCYTLSGAVYTIYSDSGCSQSVASLTLGNNRSSEEAELPAGTYYVKETKAPKGFQIDKGVHALEVKAGGSTMLPVNDKPKTAAAELDILKLDAETGQKTPQGGASLEGAEFVWKYYDGFYTVENLPQEPVRTWITQTKEEKESDGTVRYAARLSDACKVSGDEFYRQDGNVCLPLGTVTVEEKKAPEGYLLEGACMKKEEVPIDQIYVAQIIEEGETAVLKAGGLLSVSDQVIRGGVRVGKRDLETGLAEAQGGASIEGGVFSIITLNKNPVIVRGSSYTRGQEVARIKTDSEGIAVTEADLLPYGDYRLEEVEAPEGYLKEGIIEREFQIRENEALADLASEDTAIYDQVKRGDIEGVKIADGTHKRLAGVPFKITSKTTGESHVVVTDKNGNFSTASEWNPHGQNVNKGKSAGDGVWFGTSEPEDDKGALIYDTYEIEELSCDSNEGYEKIPAFEVEVYRDSQIINLGTLTDDYKSPPQEERQEEEKKDAVKSSAPKTGDDAKAEIVVFSVLLILSCAILLGCVTIRRRMK